MLFLFYIIRRPFSSMGHVLEQHGASERQSINEKIGGNMSATASVAHINVWEDDPEPAVQTSRPAPVLSHKPLAFSFPEPAPAPGVYDPGTPQFRYWTAAEALRRGADFWAPLLGVNSWQVGATLPVILDEGEDLNAF